MTCSVSLASCARLICLPCNASTNLVAMSRSHPPNSILYQRGLYPPEDFKMVKKYGLNMLVSNDDSLVAYLRKIMTQLNSGSAATQGLARLKAQTPLSCSCPPTRRGESQLMY